jgi:hypothetical protein
MAGPLTRSGDADMMSDMKTFTVRELDRSPGKVLAASRADGRARIRERGGRTYIIAPESAPEKRIAALPDFAKRRGRILVGTLSATEVRQLDEAIAGG